MIISDTAIDSSALPDEAMLPAEPDAEFDRMAGLARRVLGAPLATVTLVTREAQLFPGAAGLRPELQEARSNDLSYSLCRHVVAGDRPLVVADATEVEELADNRSVVELGIRAYAGMPLRDADETTIGSLCVMDYAPRTWSDDDLAILADLAAACTSQLQLRQVSIRTAVTSERDRIGLQLQQDVVGALFKHSLTLSDARARADGDVARQITIAIEDVDAILVRLRNSVYDVA